MTGRPLSNPRHPFLAATGAPLTESETFSASNFRRLIFQYSTPPLPKFVTYTRRHMARSSAAPQGMLGQPEDIASAVAYLASPESRLITGTTITVDAGYHLA
jgi:NAD(P)-dependent dehydrogenase (short-subunit alcohol dehydrogenase family)